LVLDAALLLILLAIEPFCLALESGHLAAISALLPLLAGSVAMHLGSLDKTRLVSVILLAWGFLAGLARLSVTIHFAGLSLSLQHLFLILLVFLLLSRVFLKPPSRIAALSLNVIGPLFLLFLAPAACISGALTLQTPQIFIYALLFTLMLEPLRRLLESFAVRCAFSAYVVILTAVAAIHGMGRS
jgi:hypothetical protein